MEWQSGSVRVPREAAGLLHVEFLFDCYPRVPFCGRIDRRVAGAEAQRLLWRQHLLICQGSRWDCIEKEEGVNGCLIARHVAVQGSWAGRWSRQSGESKSRERASACPLVRFLCLCQMALSFQ